MLESMIVKAVRASEVEWDSPDLISIKERRQSDFVTYKIKKGAESFLHKQIDIKPATSKEVYKKEASIWKNLRDAQIGKINDPDMRDYFDLNKSSVLYLVNSYNELVDVIDVRNENNIPQFEEALEKYVIDITTTEKTKKFFADGKGGFLKLVCYDKDADLPGSEYTPIVIIEFNNEKSDYKVYTGILIYESFTFVPSLSSYIESDSISKLIQILDIKNALDYSISQAQSLYDSIKTAKNNPIEVSARELIGVLRKVGYKLELQEDSSLAEIVNLSDEEGNAKITDFFNTFRFTTGESAYDILSLTEIKKIFRYNKLTLLDLLNILSKEYLTYDGSKITCDILTNLIYTMYDKQNDKGQAESIKHEIAE